MTEEHLPKPGQRWTVERKLLLIVAVRSDVISLEEAMKRYSMTREEFEEWSSKLDQWGTKALKARKAQIYRHLVSGEKEALPREVSTGASDVPCKQEE